MYYTMDRNVNVNIQSPMSILGDLQVAQQHPLIRQRFTYGTVQDVQINNSLSGNVSVSNAQCVLSVGSEGLSCVESTRQIFHTQGISLRFSGIFDITGIQECGVGNNQEGFFFASNSGTMGTLVRSGGQFHSVRLQITTSCTATNTCSVTLNSIVYLVPLVAGDPTSLCISKLSQMSYPGWRTVRSGNTIYFISLLCDDYSGVFAFSGGATGVLGSTSATPGIKPTEDFTGSLNWLFDQGDGTEDLPLIDFGLGNQYQITLNWSGYGYVLYSMKDPVSGRFLPLHYANFSNSVTNPIIRYNNTPFHYLVKSDGSNPSSMSLSDCELLSTGIPNMDNLNTHIFSTSQLLQSSNLTFGTNAHILTIQNAPIYQNTANRSEVHIKTISITTRCQVPSFLFITKNANLSDPGDPGVVYVAQSPQSCAVSYGGSGSGALTVSGGSVLFQTPFLAGDHSAIINLEPLNILLSPGDTLSVSTNLAANVTIHIFTYFATLTWSEMY